MTPYRLEMQAKADIGDVKNLYEFWEDLLYRSVIDDSRIIINLASKEYSKCITSLPKTHTDFLHLQFQPLPAFQDDKESHHPLVLKCHKTQTRLQSRTLTDWKIWIFITGLLRLF